MNVNELMIGDWVYYDRSYPVKVETIALGEINRTVATSFSPIPLTPEILEKNGWMKVEVDGVFYPKQLKGELPWIGYATNEDSWRFRIKDFCEIKYVHELRHALQLCGIEKEINL